MVTLAFVAKMRERIRIEDDVFDSELRDLVEAAREELCLAGISRVRANDEQDALVTAAIVTYLKAEFGLDIKESQAYRDAFEMKRRKLALSSKYLEKKRGGG